MKLLPLLLTVAVAAVGGILAKRARIPNGAMTGALLFVILYELLTRRAYFPVEIKIYIQVLSGALIGQKLTAGDLRRMRTLVLPILLQIVLMLLLNVVFGLLMIFMGGLDVPTGLFSCAPGGVQDMALIASDYGADPIYVSMIQMLRLVIIVMCMPGFYRALMRRRGVNMPVTDMNAELKRESKALTKAAAALHPALRAVLTLLTAYVGGMLFRLAGVRSGALIGAIVSTTCLNLFTGINLLPPLTKEITQISAGAYVGALLSYEAMRQLPALIVPILIMLVGLFVFVYFSGLLIHRLFGFDLLTSLLMCTPGGIQEMTLMAQDMDCDISKVTIMHVVRVLATLSLFPPIIGLLSRLIG